jgi:PAS domain S-box-containing protein
MNMKNTKENADLDYNSSLCRSLFEETPNACILWSNDQRVILWNKQATNIFGYTKEEATGKTAFDIIVSPQSHTTAGEKWGLLKNGDEKTQYRFDNYRKDGSEITCEWTNILIKDNHGRKMGILSLVKDNTHANISNEILQESELQYNKLFETANDAIFIMKEDYLIDFNPMTIELIGYAKNELIGKSIIELSPSFQPDGISSSVKFKEKHGLIKIGTPQKFEWTIFRKDQSIIYTELSINRIEFSEEPFLFVIVRDITQHKLEEKALIESHLFNEEIISGAGDGIIVYDVNLRYQIWNPFMEKITGIKAVEVLGKNALAIFPTMIEQGLDILLKQVLDGKTEVSVESLFIQPKTGNPIWFSSKFVPHRNYNGQIIGVIGTLRDITEKKQVVEYLLRSEERFSQVVKSTGEWIWETNPEGLYHYSNSAVEEISGYSPEELVGKIHFYDLFVPENKESMINSAMAIFKQKGSFVRFVNAIKHKNGKTVILETSGEPVIDKNNKIIGYCGVHTDITERVKYEKQMHQQMLGTNILLELHEKASLLTDNDLFDFTLDKLIKLTDSKIGFFFQLVENEQTISLTTWDIERMKENTSPSKKYYSLKSNGHWGNFLNQKKPILNNNFMNSSNHEGLPKGHPIINRFMSLPIVARKKIRYIFGVGNKIEEYNKYDMFHLQIIANELNKIIDQRNAELELRRSEKKYRLLFENMTSGFALCEMIYNKNAEPIDFRYLEMNPAFERMTGFNFLNVSEILASKITKDPVNKWIDHFIKVVENGASYSFQKFVKPMNKYLDFYVFRPQKGQFAILLNDITERKKNEETLRILSRAVEQSQVSIIITDINGIIEYVNPKFLAVTQYSKEKVLGQTPRILKTGHTSQTEYAKLWHAIISGNEWKGMFCNKKKNGEYFWESAVISPILNDQGNITHFVAVKEDITTKRETEQRMVNAIIEVEENTKNHFSRELHDGLGPLLSTIKLYFQWLCEATDPEMRKTIIEKGNINLEEAIQSIREISNDLSPRILNNFGYIPAIESFIDKINETRTIEITFKTNTHLRFAKEVELTLYRISNELINNTIKHGYATCVDINFIYDPTNEHVEFIYIDNGVGFNVNKTFEARKGLGLFNMVQRIEMLNGKISIESGIGKGIKVFFELPLDKKTIFTE